ncbi:MAG TPA: transketolase [Candidatus Fournierella pullicola]|uniref:Transketolase n=1 Tax=Candidatus Allofournierella pullicola TaxID=2838596 RepID=A0A9D1V2E1_9FIRM|nr:transketolase [Candidatus Fournierella pullicola]
MTKQQELELKKLACKARMGVLTATHGAKAGHPGGSLSAADALTYLYFKEMKVDPADPKAEDRDRFVLSKGHAAPGLYSVLALRGYFPVEDLPTLRHTDSYLQGHPNMNTVPGVDMSTGSLGQGISAACGMALAAKYKKQPSRVYALLGDGELQEGEVWEAAMFAAHYKLDNLCVMADLNGLQIDGPVAEVMNPGPVDEKFKAFGFFVQVIDGHSFEALETAFAAARAEKGRPSAILLKTTKGKGVSYMENNVGWHGKAPNDAEYEQGMAELTAALEKLEGETV